MGKIKGRKKDGGKKLGNSDKGDPVQVPEISGNDVPLSGQGMSDFADNVFSGIDISLRDLNTSLNEDSRSVLSISKKSFKGKTLSKEERRRLRRQTFLENITSHTHSHKKKKKKSTRKPREEQEERPPLEKISLSALLSKCKESEMNNENGILKTGTRQKKMLKDIESLQNIWQESSFKACPSTAVSGALQKRITEEAEKDDC